MQLRSATSVVRTLTGEALTPIRCTQPNMHMYLKQAREATGILGIGLAAVDSAARRVNIKVPNRIDGSTLNNFITELSRALDPRGQYGELRLR